MRTSTAALKVGITAVLIGLLSFGLFRFVSTGIQGKGGFHVWALFHDATGLVDKSRVQVAGLTIGEIVDRQLEGTLAKVTVRLKPDIKVWSNATVFKKSSSLLGEFYLEIDPGTPRSPFGENHLLKDGDQIMNVVEAVTCPLPFKS